MGGGRLLLFEVQKSCATSVTSSMHIRKLPPKLTGMFIFQITLGMKRYVALMWGILRLKRVFILGALFAAQKNVMNL